MTEQAQERRPLAAKLAGAMAEIGGTIAHDARNEQQKYGYTSAAAVLSRAQSALATQGVAYSTTCEILSSEWGKTKSGGDRWLVTLAMTVTLTDGYESMSVQSIGCGSDSGDKAPFKAQTSALKYALSQALCIGLGDDPEADESTDREPAQYERGNGQQAAPQQSRGNGRGGGMPHPQLDEDGRPVPDQDVPFGKYKGTPLADVPDDYIGGMIRFFGRKLDEGEASDPDSVKAWREAFQHESIRRQENNTQEQLGDDEIPF